MACVEHECTRCTWATMNNIARVSFCPRCGGDVRSTFDEADDMQYGGGDCDDDDDGP